MATRCVVCNACITNGNHHCDEKTIAHIERGRKAHTDRERDSYPANYGTRLGVGFFMLGHRDYDERKTI